MEKETKEVYVTKDGKVFLTEARARGHERFLSDTKYFQVHYDPDLNETGSSRKIGYVAVIANHSHELYALDYMYKKFGSQVAYVQGQSPTRNWTLLTGSSTKPSKGSYLGTVRNGKFDI